MGFLGECRSRRTVAVLGAVVIVAGCGSGESGDDGSAKAQVTKVTHLPDACTTPPRARAAKALGAEVDTIGSERTKTEAWCVWSDGSGLDATVHVDVRARDADTYLQKLSGSEDLQRVEVPGAAAGWATDSDLEEVQLYYAAAALDGAVYAVEVSGSAGAVSPRAAIRMVRAAVASLD
jgi:hypothetical protein